MPEKYRLGTHRGKWSVIWKENGQSRYASLNVKVQGEDERQLAHQRFTSWVDQLTKPAIFITSIVEDYLKNRKRNTGKAEPYAWKRLAPVFGPLRPDQVNRNRCRAYIAERYAAGVGDGTILRELGVLRAALTWHDKHTQAHFEMSSAPPPRDYWITKEEYTRLLEAALRTPHIYLFVLLAYTTAGRAGAILDLTWDRVRFEQGSIELGDGSARTKGRATVPIHESALAALREAHGGAQTRHVIEYGGDRVRSIKKAFARAAVRAGLSECTPHVLRHSAAVHMAEQGIDLHRIGQFLGHTNIQTTYRVYARHSIESLREASHALTIPQPLLRVVN